jgi:hypothetical protein
MIPEGSWVEIHRVVLEPGARAPQVPEDTRKVPLELRARGFLLRPASVGERVEVRTLAGRVLGGTLSLVNPGYDHGFGEPIPELLPIARELRELLGRRDAGDEL